MRLWEGESVVLEQQLMAPERVTRRAARVPRGRMRATEVRVRDAASKLVKWPHSRPAKMTGRRQRRLSFGHMLMPGKRDKGVRLKRWGKRGP